MDAFEVGRSMSKTGLARAHAEPWLVFVDTSVLLRVYESPQPNLLGDLRELGKHPDCIITTFVVRDEFMRNRHRVMNRLAETLAKIAEPKIVDFARQWPEGKAFQEAAERSGQAVKALVDKWKETMENPAKNDAVWSEVHKILDANSDLALASSSEDAKAVLARAQLRRALGNPPGNDAGATLGDATNWEWCLEVCRRRKANLVVLTADGDYGSERRGDDYLPNMLLYDEFQRAVGTTRLLAITTRTTKALELIGQAVTPEQKRGEEVALRDVIESRLGNQFLGGPVSPSIAALLGLNAQHSILSQVDPNVLRMLRGDFTDREMAANRALAQMLRGEGPPVPKAFLDAVGAKPAEKASAAPAKNK